MLMDGMARPGTIRAVAPAVAPPAPLGMAAGAIALTLCDHDTPVWLTPALAQIRRAAMARLPYRCAGDPRKGRGPLCLRRSRQRACLLRPLCAGHAGISGPLDDRHHRTRRRLTAAGSWCCPVPASTSAADIAPKGLPEIFLRLMGREPRALSARRRSRADAGQAISSACRAPIKITDDGGLSHVCCRQGRRSRHRQCPSAAGRQAPRRPRRCRRSRIDQIVEQLALAVDRVMAEASLYDRTLAALAVKQARGDMIEAIFLLRAYRTTLPRFGYSRAGRHRGDDGRAARVGDLQGSAGRPVARPDLRLYPPPARSRRCWWTKPSRCRRCAKRRTNTSCASPTSSPRRPDRGRRRACRTTTVPATSPASRWNFR